MNKDQYRVNYVIHGKDTGQKPNLRGTVAFNLSLYKRVAYYMGIKIFSSFAIHIRDLSKNFKRSKLVFF